MKILVINGPNLNMLGVREPQHYGTATYGDLVAMIKSHADSKGIYTECKQSNHEGELVEFIQSAYNAFDGIVINPAAYTHTSIAILDAVKAVGVPCVEVHISDVSKRESYRQVSYVREACIATITGEGFAGYLHAMDILCDNDSRKSK